MNGRSPVFLKFSTRRIFPKLFVKMLWNRGFISSLFWGKHINIFVDSRIKGIFLGMIPFCSSNFERIPSIPNYEARYFPKYIHWGRIFFLASEAHYFSQYNRIRNRFFPFRIQWDLQKFAFILTPKLDFSIFFRLYFPTISFPKGKNPPISWPIKISVSK